MEQRRPAALDHLLPIVYGELRYLAETYLRRERSCDTLQPTALVHEAFLRLVDVSDVTWQNRAHFFGIAARLMRQILVDHARHRNAAKHGGGWCQLSLDEAINFFRERDVNLIRLDDALMDLERIDRYACQVVELKFFGGLTIDEIAEMHGVSTATINREWRAAKLWLLREISATVTSSDG